MNYAVENEKIRNYYKKDFSKLNELVQRIRTTLATGEKLKIDDLVLEDIIEFKGKEQLFYITLFQEFTKRIRFGSRRDRGKEGRTTKGNTFWWNDNVENYPQRFERSLFGKQIDS